MGVKTALPKTRTTATATKAKPKTQAKKSQPRSGGGQFGSTAQKPGRTGGRTVTTAQMNKGKGAVGASKPPKGVARPSGGSKPKGGKSC